MAADGPPPPDPPDLLDAISTELAALHLRYHGREPRSTSTNLIDDELVVCVFSGIYTTVEKTMIEIGREATVHQTRSEFQQAMSRRFVAVVERLSGRVVGGFSSMTNVGPDLEVNVFLLEPAGPEPSEA